MACASFLYECISLTIFENYKTKCTNAHPIAHVKQIILHSEIHRKKYWTCANTEWGNPRTGPLSRDLSEASAVSRFYGWMRGLYN